MDVLVTYLDEDRTALGQEILCNSQSITQVREV